ncbi:YARHG domain-containing protein [Aquimarina sp. I32.4]|uniref:YARHG domain-containing protein n=1 Tax=Aquimarina sp. I32.4 TaxID=2053903 RepID=UPI000CDEB68E|nr:YARHG domain-containing protein [Aquimarina sp. I32.4]
MKKIILLIIAITIFSCKKEEKKHDVLPNKEEINKAETETPDDVSKKQETVPDSNSNLLGFYVGAFITSSYEDVHKKKGSYHNRINISVDRIQNDSLYGHSVVAGNSRPFKGSFDKVTLFAKVTEPGDDKYDGVFEFTLYPEKNKIKGVWIANNNQLAVPKRKYDLDKKEFEYNAGLNLHFDEEYDYNLSLHNSQDEENGEFESIDPSIISKLNASSQELTNQDVENLNKGELEILRNLIYARHGYSFKNRKMRYFFDSAIDWYIPVSTDVRKELTSLENKNIELIKRYEQHAKRYYDYFGR